MCDAARNRDLLKKIDKTEPKVLNSTILQQYLLKDNEMHLLFQELVEHKVENNFRTLCLRATSIFYCKCENYYLLQ